jgi:hypothetical protein
MVVAANALRLSADTEAVAEGAAEWLQINRVGLKRRAGD